MTSSPLTYRPPWWYRGRHLQTLWGPLLRRRRRPALRRERVETPDGDFIDLDWLPGRERGAPVIVILHGLEGSARSHYAVGLLRELAKLGWRGLVIHFRSCSGEINRSRRMYHSGDTEDLAEVTVRFSSGVLAQVHLDYLRRAYRRDLEVVGADGVISWDYASRTVRVLGPGPDQAEVHDGATDGPNETMYVEEMRHFIRCLEGREEPLADGWEALRSLRMVEAAKTAAAERRWVSL